MRHYKKHAGNGNSTVIQLITTINTDNEPVYAYLMLSADKWMILQERLTKEIVDLSTYGQVLAYGHGHEPDVKTQEAIQKISDTLNHTD